MDIPIGIVIGQLVVLLLTWVVLLTILSFHVQNGRVQLVRWWRQPIAQQVAGIAILGILETSALVALGTDHRPPFWVYAIIFGNINLYAIRWVWLTWRIRKTIRPPEGKACDCCQGTGRVPFDESEAVA